MKELHEEQVVVLRNRLYKLMVEGGISYVAAAKNATPMALALAHDMMLD